LSGLLPPFIHTKYILIIEVKVHFRRMHHGILTYIEFHASVKNALSSSADSLGNSEMCPSKKIFYHAADSKTQCLSKMLI